jgi:hypothetical protein
MLPRMCPDCDADLMETSTGVEMTSQQRRYTALIAVRTGARSTAKPSSRTSRGSALSASSVDINLTCFGICRSAEAEFVIRL